MSWSQYGGTVNGDDITDGFGDDVALNALGNIMVIGSQYDDNDDEQH